VGRQLFDAPDVAGAAVEATADLGVGDPTRPPLQHAALDRAQRGNFRLDAGVMHSGVGDDAVDERRLAAEPSSDLAGIDAVGDEA